MAERAPAQPRRPTSGAGLGARWQDALILAFSLVFAYLLLLLFQLFAQALELLFLDIIIGQALDPVVGRLSTWIPRSIAIVVICVLLVAVLAVVAWFVVPGLYVDAQHLVRDIPGMISRARTGVNHLAPGQGDHIISAVRSYSSHLMGLLVSLPLRISSIAVKFMVVVFFSIYWMLTAPALFDFTLSLVPESRKDDAHSFLDELGSMLGGYIRGDVLDSILIGIAAFIGMRVMGVHFALVIGLVTAFGDLIPLVGPTVAQFLAAAIALEQSPLLAIITLAYFLILQQIDGNVTMPIITRGTARIPPLLILFALVAGGLAGGILGAIIAIPLSGAIRLMVVRIAAPIFRDWWAGREAAS
jgi:predicted PurR-regulated permease PerM